MSVRVSDLETESGDGMSGSGRSRGGRGSSGSSSNSSRDRNINLGDKKERLERVGVIKNGDRFKLRIICRDATFCVLN